MLTIQLNHECDKISDVLGITNEQLIKTKAAMIFGVLTPKVLASQLFDDSSEIPSNMKTASGCIEKIIEYLETDGMKTFVLLNFFSFYERMMSGYLLCENKSKLDEILSDEKDDFKKAIKKLAALAQLKSVEYLIDYTKEANGNFDKFFELIKDSLEKAESVSDMFNENLDDDDE